MKVSLHHIQTLRKLVIYIHTELQTTLMFNCCLTLSWLNFWFFTFKIILHIVIWTSSNLRFSLWSSLIIELSTINTIIIMCRLFPIFGLSLKSLFWFKAIYSKWHVNSAETVLSSYFFDEGKSTSLCVKWTWVSATMIILSIFLVTLRPCFRYISVFL